MPSSRNANQSGRGVDPDATSDAMLIDTHCHIDATDFDPDREAVLDAARDAGVKQFVVPGVEVAGFEGIAQLAVAQPGLSLAYGIHPLYVQHAYPEDLGVLEDWLASRNPVAVGEIGLDHFVADADHALQERYFVAQLKLAQRFGLPVILHVRRAVDAILKQLRRIEVPGGIAHAFNGSRQQADIFVGMGFKLGFGGAMTFEGSRRIRQLAASLPLEAIVLETDAPDIPPAWAGGRRNEPANLARYCAILAELRGAEVAEIAAATTRNAWSALPGLPRLGA